VPGLHRAGLIMTDLSPPRLLPPHYFLLALLVIFGLGWWGSGSLLPDPWPWLGVIPVLAGLWLAIAGARQFARAETNIVPFTESTTLVTDGVFAYTRNPMYLGMVLVLAGAALLTNVAVAWLVVVGFAVFIQQRFIRHEERLMEETFGDEYRAYKARVRRWL